MSNKYARGGWKEDDAREPWFLCEAHTEEIIDETLNKFEESVKEAIA
jgi:glutamate-1-semialdehyde aminotransferase